MGHCGRHSTSSPTRSGTILGQEPLQLQAGAHVDCNDVLMLAIARQIYSANEPALQIAWWGVASPQFNN